MYRTLDSEYLAKLLLSDPKDENCDFEIHMVDDTEEGIIITLKDTAGTRVVKHKIVKNIETFAKCKYNDCGWCYSESSRANNECGQCLAPETCTVYKENL